MNSLILRPNTKSMRIKPLYISVALLISLSFGGCKEGGGTAETVRKWKTMEVAAKDIVLETPYSATIRGKQDIELRAQMSGLIAEVRVAEGERVHKGEVLFVIDQVPYKAALRQASANVKSAQAALANARLDLNSKKVLNEKRIISDYDLQRTENDFLAAEAALAQAEAAETKAPNDLSYTEVKSPADGIVGILPYRQGALVGPDTTEPLTTVSDNSEMYVYFSMDEKQLLAYIRKHKGMDGAKKNIGEVSLTLSDGTVYGHKGCVESISGVVDRNTGTATLRAVFPNPDGLLYSGTTGNVQVSTTYRNVLVIPQSATVKLQDRILAYKVEDGRAVSTLIEIEQGHNGREYIVTDGLVAGDVIVSERVGLLREGTTIKTGEGQ